MNSAFAVVDLLAGGLSSLVFYGGLWMTVRALLVTRHPVALTLGSWLLRTAAVACGLVLVARGRWQNAAVYCAGFVLGRIAVSKVVLRCA